MTLDELIARLGAGPREGRDTMAAAQALIAAPDDWLETIAHRDPGMIRDVAAALIFERSK
jgi:hypothetical protein